MFGQENLSGEFGLDGGGHFAMPLIGEIQAGGLTTRELELQIRQKFMTGYLLDPQIGVEVLNYRPFYILGEVKNPGSYPYVDGMAALNAVALAGGFTYRAKQGEFLLRRGELWPGSRWAATTSSCPATPSRSRSGSSEEGKVRLRQARGGRCPVGCPRTVDKHSSSSTR